MWDLNDSHDDEELEERLLELEELLLEDARQTLARLEHERRVIRQRLGLD